MDTVADLLNCFEQINEIGASLTNERDIKRLLENILLAAKAITQADGGGLYRVSEDRTLLHFEIVRTASLNMVYGGATGEPIAEAFKALPLFWRMGKRMIRLWRRILRIMANPSILQMHTWCRGLISQGRGNSIR